jgi:hypothetical protein
MVRHQHIQEGLLHPTSPQREQVFRFCCFYCQACMARGKPPQLDTISLIKFPLFNLQLRLLFLPTVGEILDV